MMAESGFFFSSLATWFKKRDRFRVEKRGLRPPTGGGALAAGAVRRCGDRVRAHPHRPPFTAAVSFFGKKHFSTESPPVIRDRLIDPPGRSFTAKMYTRSASFSFNLRTTRDGQRRTRSGSWIISGCGRSATKNGGCAGQNAILCFRIKNK